MQSHFRLCTALLSCQEVPNYLWQAPEEGQFSQPHPQPQEEPPRRFRRIIETITPITTAATTAATNMVARFAESHASILFPPFYLIRTRVVSVFAS